MHADAPRVNGGVGFALEEPRTTIIATEGSDTFISDQRVVTLSPEELDRVTSVVAEFVSRHRLARRPSVEIRGDVLTHTGLGSGTSITLGAMEAAAALNDFVVPHGTLVAASGRGGTSGVGVKTYFEGGLVLDLGRPNDGRRLAPSSRSRAGSAPLAVPSLSPPQWPIVLCVPSALASKTSDEELAFFERTAPLPVLASQEAAYVALFQIYASAAEGDYHRFCAGIERMQETAWKRAEIAEHGDGLVALSSTLRRAGADCVAMSSLGPALVCLAAPARTSVVQRAATDAGCTAIVTSFARSGRELSDLDA